MARRMINSSRYQKYATVMITKQLEQIAEDLEKDVTEIVKDKLLETYKNNVLASYSPRSEAGLEVKEYNERQKIREIKEGTNRLHRKKLTYRHTNTFINAIDVKVENKYLSKYVKVIIKGDKTYDDGTPVTEVYEYLTKGTDGSEGTYAYKTDNGITGARNYPTPRHLFEEHTSVEMKGFLDNLENNIIKNKTYNKRKYTKKRG